LNYTRLSLPTRSPSLCAGVTPYVPVLRPAGQRRYSPLFKLASCQFVEPSLKAWEASVLPLNYTRKTIQSDDTTHSVKPLLHTFLCISQDIRK